jgi:predicted RNA binding protein YcfA (HicA-like mRNA interferase family)
MPRPVKVRTVIQLLRKDSWYLVATQGSHRQYKHATKKGRVTVAGKLSDELSNETMKSILRQSGLKN